MADFGKLRRSRLGSPPPPGEASGNLAAPETAPASVPPAGPAPAGRIDGRSLRRTARTVGFSTRVTPEFDLRLREIARRDRLLLTELLEHALAAYERERGRG